MQLGMLILALVITLGFGALAVMGLILIGSPETAERWARRRSHRMGLDFDAVVSSPERYRSTLRRQGIMMLIVAVLSWIVLGGASFLLAIMMG